MSVRKDIPRGCKLTIAVDFDGTCVTHECPAIGKDIGSAPVLQALVNHGHKLILYTMRGQKFGAKNDNLLQPAIDWFKENDIPLHHAQVNPEQSMWTNSPKCHADLYIDDSALGVPLIHSRFHPRPYVDWTRVRLWLKDSGLLPIDWVPPYTPTPDQPSPQCCDEVHAQRKLDARDKTYPFWWFVKDENGWHTLPKMTKWEKKIYLGKYHEHFGEITEHSIIPGGFAI